MSFTWSPGGQPSEPGFCSPCHYSEVSVPNTYFKMCATYQHLGQSPRDFFFLMPDKGAGFICSCLARLLQGLGRTPASVAGSFKSKPGKAASCGSNQGLLTHAWKWPYRTSADWLFKKGEGQLSPVLPSWCGSAQDTSLCIVNHIESS